MFFKSNRDGMYYWVPIAYKHLPVREETEIFISECRRLHARHIPKVTETYGELFFLRYVHKLTTHDHLYLMKACNPIEGKDGKSANLFGYNGNIEVKTISHFINRNDIWIQKYRVDHEPTGTIPFEVFHRWDIRAEDRYPGWLLSLFGAEQYTKKVKQAHNRPETSEPPGTLAYILMKENGEPFACVAFEDMYKLLTRLLDILPFKRWNIPKMEIPSATDIAYWRNYIRDGRYQPAWDPDRGGMIQNCWHVPFKTLADLATVTMIGEVNPAEEVKKSAYAKIPEQVGRQRVQFLQELAAQQGRETFADPDAYTKQETEYIKKLEEQTGEPFRWRNYTHGVQQLTPKEDNPEEWNIDDGE